MNTIYIGNGLYQSVPDTFGQQDGLTHTVQPPVASDNGNGANLEETLDTSTIINDLSPLLVPAIAYLALKTFNDCLDNKNSEI